ncbi:iron complex outermembrane receptor protein [Hephaestia caeni]|uniref:Iron complex outermembrane receptor protein n=1 Tax=Hephaestia caeni TaxID=645617 RepID=A0A397NRZ1_9SPHN|nr:TonB-dependent receptor [Hephaestia caeni]RIA37957.1 iron complex outermembrane receptor protein [Hephaestia caeni]
MKTRDRLLSAVAALAMATAASAQAATPGGGDPGQATPTTSDAADPAQAVAPAPIGDEIIVTAQRRSERLQDVPISLAVVAGDTLQDRSIQTFEQLAPLVPNLTIAKSPAANMIILRGIGSSPGSPSLDQSVVMFIDGIYGGNARQFSAPFLDIERLEILRGPQGALVGRNTSAGAINVISRKPGHEFGGYVNALYNFAFDGPTVEGAVDLPVSDAVRFRVAGKYSDMGGYLYNSYLDEDQPSRREAVGRIVGVVDNGGPVVVTAKYEHSDVRSNGIPMQVLAPTKGYPLDRSKDTYLQDDNEYDNIHANNASLQFDVDLGGPTLVSISGYSAFVNRSLIDADFYSGNFATAIFNQKFDQVSQELRLVSPDAGTFRYVVGGYYSDSKLMEQRTTGVLFAPPASTYREFRQNNEVYSAFGQLTAYLTSQLRLNGSLRYTHESKTAHYKRWGGPQAATDYIGVLQEAIAGDIEAGRVDPAVGIQYEFSRNAMVYATFSKGSKSGGFQGAISNATAEAFEFRPERSTSYEIGAKLTLPGVGFLNLAAFDTIYKDLQVSAQIPTNGSLTAAIFTGNAPEARVKGIEAEFSARLASFFRFDGSLSWLPQAKYVEFTSGPCYPLQEPDGSVIGSCDQSGERLGFSPRWSGAMNFTAETSLGSDLRLTGTLSPRFQSRSYRDFMNDPVTEQKSFTKLDARIAIGAEDGGWELALVGQNLTNELTVGFGGAGGLANTFLDPGAHIVTIDPPRNISVQAKIRF